jgi:diphosphoinositol-polyphosphate diphosphatase
MEGGTGKSGTGSPVQPARQGREKQRYGEDGQRLTAGCVVLREVRSRPSASSFGAGSAVPVSATDVMLNVQVEDGVRECLMISSSSDSSKWVFPKGGWENDETLEQAAQRETLEVPVLAVLQRAPL